MIYAIRIFREYSLESSKMAVVLVKARQQSTIPLPGRDVKTSNSSSKVNFQTKNRFLLKSLRNSDFISRTASRFSINARIISDFKQSHLTII